MPISWHSPPKCLQESPWPNSCSTFVTPSVSGQQKGVVDAEELMELGQLRAEHLELDGHQQERGEPSRQLAATAQGEKNQRTLG